jgi:2-dehydropantoate 2-reductase
VTKDGEKARPSVAILGAGAAGCTLAASLLQADRCSLTLGVRSIEPIVVHRGDVSEVEIPSDVQRLAISAEDRMDLLILALKAHQIAECGHWFSAIPMNAPVVAIQNGVEHESLVHAIAPGRVVVPAVLNCAARRTSATEVIVQKSVSVTAPIGRVSSMLAQIFSGSGTDIRCVDDIKTSLWRKMCEIAPTGLMAVHDAPAIIFRDPDVLVVARSLVTECVLVARAEGARLGVADIPPMLARWEIASPNAGSSILTDRRAGRRLEWESRHGAVARLGRVHAIPTPTTDGLVEALRSFG